MSRILGSLVFGVVAMAWLAPVSTAQDDLDDVRSKRFRLKDNPKLQYELIGAAGELATPEDGYKLLVVLPGGDGSADFTPFVKRIWKYSLDENYLVVQLIAPKWSNRQRVVWPTKEAPETGMKATTERFISLAVKDVMSRTKVDARNVFALAWSSGGPAAYASSVTEESPLRGVLAAMSVFKPGSMPPLEGARGRAYYILHSPDDQVCPYRMAEDAAKQLKEHGGQTKLVTYDGGHGWHGDMFGNIRSGVAWLEQNVQK